MIMTIVALRCSGGTVPPHPSSSGWNDTLSLDALLIDINNIQNFLMQSNAMLSHRQTLLGIQRVCSKTQRKFHISRKL
jgi:hypothetical protein